MTEHEPSAPALVAELLYREPVTLAADAIAHRVRALLPRTRLVSERDGGLLFAHEDFIATLAEGKHVPIFTALHPADAPQVVERRHDFTQSWSWPDARAVVAGATACVAVIEAMGQVHPPAERRQAFRAMVEALVATTTPVASWWPNATKFVRPEHAADELEGFVNVRLFRAENAPGELVMDSLGLHAFGLPDVQCHFRDLDPNAMAAVLHNTAAYVLEHGDVIADGETVPGLRGDEKWPCRHEAALVAPERTVIDLLPDPPHAGAGRRPDRRGP